ncbi:17220_t:CDS:2, partial [Cetraspora pellucida]
TLTFEEVVNEIIVETQEALQMPILNFEEAVNETCETLRTMNGLTLTFKEVANEISKAGTQHIAETQEALQTMNDSILNFEEVADEIREDGIWHIVKTSILSFEKMAKISEDQESSEAEELYMGKSFISWDKVTLFLDEFCKRHGFGYRKGHSKKSDEQNIKKRMFLCRHSGTSNSCKTASPKNQRNTQSWHILSPDTAHLLPQFRKLTKPMLAEIKFWTLEENIMASQQYQLLLSKYKRNIVKKDLYNAINHFCCQKLPTINNACNLLNDLLAKKARDSEWVIEYQIDPLTILGFKNILNICTKAKKCGQNVTQAPASQQKHQDNSEFISWKESMPYISPPNIYNTVFMDVNTEIRTFITMSIVNKIREQMNHSFLYYVKESVKYAALEKGEEVDCETLCLDEIFDLSQ